MSELTTKAHRFTAYGAWSLFQLKRVDTGELIDDLATVAAYAAKILPECWQDIRVVEVEIYCPVNGKYEYITGYTFDKRIPPHRRDHKDVDCRVTVVHHYLLKQLEG